MTRTALAYLCACLIAATTLLTAQDSQLPSSPRKQFGGSITGAFDGWFKNADGSHSFLLGYFSRNTRQVVEIPIGPNNRIEPGGPDMGQPTHFLPGRNPGIFTITVPKEFAAPQELTWTLTVNGQTTKIPLRLKPDYSVEPFGGPQVGNTPPVVRFEEHGAAMTGPIAGVNRLIRRTTSVARALPLQVWVDDDARYTSGTGAPMRNPTSPVSVHWTKYRGDGTVTFANAAPAFHASKGGAVGQPYSGTALTTATFSKPGEYMLHAVINDYSGKGGGGEVCCWTDALIAVTVSPDGVREPSKTGE